MKFFIVVAAAILWYASAAPRRLRTVEFGLVLQNHRHTRSITMDVERSMDASMSISEPPPPPLQFSDISLPLNSQTTIIDDNISELSTETLMSMSYSLPQNGSIHHLPSTPFPSGGDSTVQVLPERDGEVSVGDVVGGITTGADIVKHSGIKMKHIFLILSLVMGFCLGLVSGVSKCMSDEREKTRVVKEKKRSDEREENAFFPTSLSAMDSLAVPSQHEGQNKSGSEEREQVN